MLHGDSGSAAFIDCRKHVALQGELWQTNLLTPRDLQDFARRRGIGLDGADSIRDLWRVGLLRADAVRAPIQHEFGSILKLKESSNAGIWLDARRLPSIVGGYGNCLAQPDPFPGATPLFHPFRTFVLYHVSRVFDISASSLQYLRYKPGFETLVRFHTDHLDHWTAGQSFIDSFERWNTTAELAIILEPCSLQMNARDLHDEFDNYWSSLGSIWSEWTLESIHKVREALCHSAEILDDNKLLHVALRLMAAHERGKLRSAIGGAMLFLQMAEVIRRAAERGFDRHLPEEDELGFAQWMPGARAMLYGTERIFDARLVERRDFLTSMGLDAGVKARCYVEGATEYGALATLVGKSKGLELCDLRGQVVEAKGIAFIDSLARDMESGIFSIVVLDGDLSDNVRAVRKADTEKRMFGSVFVCEPDFELDNFCPEELVDVVLQLAAETGCEAPEKSQLIKDTSDARSADDFFATLRRHQCHFVQKGETWGAALAQYAARKPLRPPEHQRGATRRTILEVAHHLEIARIAGYARSVRSRQLNQNTRDP